LSTYLARASLSVDHLHCFTGTRIVHGQVIFLTKVSAALTANITVCLLMLVDDTVTQLVV
jgi:hypothetical protein